MRREYSIKLYNVIFPIWILWLIPITWLVVLPANFLIDLLVLVITLRCLKVENRKRIVKSSIWKVWLLGFLADFIGTAFMFLAGLIRFAPNSPIYEWWYSNIVMGVNYDPFHSVYSFLWTTVCIIITGFCIYWFNYKISFKKTDLPKSQKKRLALSLAVVTVPYLFYLPTRLFYHW